MVITTKYNYGDEVWFMKDNKPEKGNVFIVTAASTDKGLGANIKYDINYGEDREYDEYELFPDKESLLKSL